MALRVKPNANLSLEVGEEVPYELSMVDHLDGDTVASHTMTITDSGGGDVTSNFEGGSAESSGILSFGIKAYATGIYTVTFWVTCNEELPDGTTPREFKVTFTLTVS